MALSDQVIWFCGPYQEIHSGVNVFLIKVVSIQCWLFRWEYGELYLLEDASIVLHPAFVRNIAKSAVGQ